MYLKDIKEITRILEIIRNYLYVFPAESVNRSSGFFVISLWEWTEFHTGLPYMAMSSYANSNDSFSSPFIWLNSGSSLSLFSEILC